jgi:hypothetical protein
MQNRVTAVLVAITLICLLPAAGHALLPYSQDFENLMLASLDGNPALADDGWLVFGNVFAPDGGYLFGYGPFPAPNWFFAFSAVTEGQGGPAQGLQQLVVFNDYNSDQHPLGNLVESNVFQEQIIGPGDVGETWVFDFQAKLGDLVAPSTALAFIKTLDPEAGFALTNFITVDMTTIPTTWSDFSLSILIDESLDGQILQIGFANTTTDYVASGVIYDNVNWYIDGPVGTEENTWGGVKSLYR